MKKTLLSTILCLAIIIAVIFLVSPKTNAESPFYYYEMGYNEWGDMQAWISGIDPSAQGDLEIPLYIGNCIITGINHNAFLDCTNITSITMPETVTFIGNSAFSGCTNLKSITIGDNVTTIHANAFSGCTSLERITLPYSVETVGEFAFSYCTSLISADLGSIDELGSMAFYKCESLKDVSLGPVEVLKSETFGHCTGLETIALPDSLTEIESRAFVYCTALKSVEMPYSSLESIGDEAFRSCSSLESITIPYGTKTIGDAVFFKCTSLTRIDVIYENGSFKSDKSGVLYNGSRTELIAVPNTLSGTYTVPDTVTSIRPAAFYGCDKLTGLSLPDSITEIGEYTFKNCSGLTTLTIPKGLTTIAESAWENCTGITQVTISDTLSVVDYSAFDGCTGLTEVYYDGTQEQWNAITIRKWNDPLLQAKLILPNAHDCTQCGQWVVSQQPTFSSAGERYLICSQCGETVTETLEMLVGKVNKLNMVLQDDFEAKFYLQVSESICSTAQVKLTVGSSLITTPISALEVTQEGYRLLPVGLTAAQMNDAITIQVINGDDQGESYQYTVRQYCDEILANSEQSQYHALIKEMLNYGAMAQLYFGHNTDNLVNEGITGVAAQAVPEETEQMSVTGALSSLSYYGASLVYRDRIAVRFYFTGDITGCTFTAGSATCTPVAKDGMHYVEIADILPQNLDQQITLTVIDSAGNSLVVTYGPMNYIVRMTQKGDEKTKNLLKALYNYHLAAKALAA